MRPISVCVSERVLTAEREVAGVGLTAGLEGGDEVLAAGRDQTVIAML